MSNELAKTQPSPPTRKRRKPKAAARGPRELPAGHKEIAFSAWPVWNFQFPEKDVMLVHAVRYIDAQGQEQLLPQERWRLAIGFTGVSTLVLFQKNSLPKLEKRLHAVFVEYQPL